MLWEWLQQKLFQELSEKFFEDQGLERGAWRHVDDEASEGQAPDSRFLVCCQELADCGSVGSSGWVFSRAHSLVQSGTCCSGCCMKNRWERHGLVWQSGECQSVLQKSGCEMMEAGKAEEKGEQRV